MRPARNGCSAIRAQSRPSSRLDKRRSKISRYALDNIFHHPNVGPFIAQRLIQHLVTSNPSPQYVERVARKFNDDGSGQRGNLSAVVKAVLLDSEARAAPASATAGKLKEPLLRLTQLWRAYGARSQSGKYNVQNITGLIGQGPLQAPSVFNFFSPFYAPPGEIANQGLVAPEMQVTTEYLSSLWTDYVFVLAFCYTTTPIQGCPPVPDALRPDLVIIVDSGCGARACVQSAGARRRDRSQACRWTDLEHAEYASEEHG